MMNQVWDLSSTKWNHHEVVKLILRSLVFHNLTQVQLICENARYEEMSPEEVIGKFVSFELMVKDSKHIGNLEQGTTPTPEPQPIAFKATKEKEETTPSKRLQLDTSKLNNEEMALIIKCSWQILKQWKGMDYKPHSKGVCYRCGKSDHHIAKCPYASDSEDKKGKKKWRTEDFTTRRRATMHMLGGEGTPTRALPTPPLTRMTPTSSSITVFSSPTLVTSASWLRREKERYNLETPPKYITFDDEGDSSETEENLSLLFKGLSFKQIEKINELVKSINEKDELLESQEDLLIRENDKFVKPEVALAHEKKKCKNLSDELKTCKDSISCLKCENVNLIATIEELNACMPLHLPLSMLLFALDVEMLSSMLLVITLL
jgi:hypothetical protein